jgi:2-dehydro-3-deoxygalactonokinase
MAAAGDQAELFRQTLARRAEELMHQAGDDAGAPPVVISGMASSSLGWRELPYARLPFPLDGSGLLWQDVGPLYPSVATRAVQPVMLISGIRGELDVMRGEETEALGLAQFLAERLPKDAVVIKPGTHAKHLRIQQGTITDFQSYMTGELFDVLRQHSVLRHSTTADTIDFVQSENLQGDFVAGVQAAAELGLSAALFRVRTRQLLENCAPPENTAFMSGVLIGAEVHDALARTAKETALVLCAGPQTSAAYQLALESLAAGDRLSVVPPTDVDRLSLLGQRVLLDRLP